MPPAFRLLEPGKSARAMSAAVAVWDPFPILCGTATCRAITDSGPLFFAGDHLSNVGNRLLYLDFASFMHQIWLGGARKASFKRADQWEHQR